ncbi:SbcC/MukB-like Walker B domain-containing protein, partial [Kaistella sp.]|uniref:SbcC/MukB-like Walker B domain-containing protein n=1 Tax=Kaistella sp. TaxID=2782235 RepID=UPI003C350083
DNKDKIKFLQNEIKDLQEKEKTALQESRSISQRIKEIEVKKEDYADLFKLFTKYDDIDWQTYANQIQEKEEVKKKLEATNDRVKTLQEQLKKVEADLKQLTDVEIWNKGQEIFELGNTIKNIEKELNENLGLLKSLGNKDISEFENVNPELLNVGFSTIKKSQSDFQNDTSTKIGQFNTRKGNKESEVRIKINAFKQPTENITTKFKDWRSDVSKLPESTNLDLIEEYQTFYKKLVEEDLIRFEKKFKDYLQETITNKVGDFRMFFENWAESIKENINHLNESLKGIDFKSSPVTYVQLVAPTKISDEVKDFRNLLHNAIPDFKKMEETIDGRENHFNNNIEPLINKLSKEDWRKKVMEVRSWFSYKAEEFYKETNQKFKTYENMGQLSGGEKPQLTYTILCAAITYQFGLTKEGLQTNSFRFIAVDESFTNQDADKAKYLLELCKQLHLQFLVVTPTTNIDIVEPYISYVHYVERKDEKYSWLYDMPIEQFKEERENFINK